MMEKIIGERGLEAVYPVVVKAADPNGWQAQCTALGIAPKGELPKKLAKSIELLVKFEALSKAGKLKPSGLPGKEAAPIGPTKPVLPTVKQPDSVSRKGSVLDTTPNAPAVKPNQVSIGVKPKLPKIPGAAPAAPAGPPGAPTQKSEIYVSKSDLQVNCPTCMVKQIEGGLYKGCQCFGDLTKSICTTAMPMGLRLDFGGLPTATVRRVLKNLSKS